MRVLYVGYESFRESGMMQMYCFANQVSKLGHEVLVLAPPDAQCKRITDSIALMDEPPLFRLEQVDFNGPLLSSKNRECVQDFGPDVVHAWTPRHIPASVVLQTRRRTNAKLLVHCQDNEEYLYGLHLEAIGRRIRWLWLRRVGHHPLYLRMLFRPLMRPLCWQRKHPLTYHWVNTAADAFTAHNPPLQRRLQTRFPDKRVDLLYTGVDLERFHPSVDGDQVRRRYELDGRPVAMYTGSLNLQEMTVFLHAIKKVRETYPNIAFAYVGGHHHTFADELQQMIVEMDMEDTVILMGEVPHKDIQHYMAAANVLLQWGTSGPVNDYRLPGKILEYMAMGKPVITYATGIGEIFDDNVDVLKTQRGDALEISSKIEEVLSSVELAERLGQCGRQMVQDLFSWSKNAHHLLGIYEGLLSA